MLCRCTPKPTMHSNGSANVATRQGERTSRTFSNARRMSALPPLNAPLSPTSKKSNNHALFCSICFPGNGSGNIGETDGCDRAGPGEPSRRLRSVELIVQPGTHDVCGQMRGDAHAVTRQPQPVDPAALVDRRIRSVLCRARPQGLAYVYFEDEPGRRILTSE